MQTPFRETTATEPDFGMWGSKIHFPEGVVVQLLPKALPLTPWGQILGGGYPAAHFLWGLGAHRVDNHKSPSEKPCGDSDSRGGERLNPNNNSTTSKRVIETRPPSPFLPYLSSIGFGNRIKPPFRFSVRPVLLTVSNLQ